jgi:hypothetical protein
LIASVQSQFPGVRITATNDAFHQGFPSKHNEGLAFDFTTTGNHEQVAAAVQAMLGSGGKVLDEYDPAKRSLHWTAPHIHVQFNDAAAAERFRSGLGGGNRTSTSDVRIGTINVNGANIKDGNDFAKSVKEAIQEHRLAIPADTGLR